MNLEDINYLIAILKSAADLADTIQALVLQVLAGIGAVAAGIVSTSAVLAKYLPPPSEPGFLSTVHKIINAAAQNSGYAANAKKE